MRAVGKLRRVGLDGTLDDINFALVKILKNTINCLELPCVRQY